MAQYRKKPVDVEAVQYIEDGAQSPIDTVLDWLDRHDPARLVGLNENGGAWIEVPTRHASKVSDGIAPGDWIVRSSDGLITCSPDIFKQTYEVV